MEKPRPTYNRAILPPGESTEQLSDDELFERFNSLAESSRAMRQQLETRYLADATYEPDIDKDRYIEWGEALPSPISDVFELTYDIFGHMGYDIVYTRSSPDPTTQVDLLKIWASGRQRPALDAMERNILDSYHTSSTELEANKLNMIHMTLSGCYAVVQAKGLDQADPDMVIRAQLAQAITLASLLPSERSHYRESIFREYAELSRKYPDAIPLGIEECAGMIAGATHRFLEANPQYKLENL